MGKQRRFDTGFYGISLTAAKLLTIWLSIKVYILKNHKISFWWTHNLEVLGSSPSWSTPTISNLEEIRVADFLSFHQHKKEQAYASHRIKWNWADMSWVCWGMFGGKSREYPVQWSPVDRDRDSCREVPQGIDHRILKGTKQHFCDQKGVQGMWQRPFQIPSCFRGIDT